MSLDFNTVKILLWGKNLGVSYKRTLTLGHQGLSCTPHQLRRAAHDFGLNASPAQLDRCFEPEPISTLYSDEFLRLLGAEELAIVDRSNFEGATKLHDLNEPFPESDRASFSVVLDGGTLEHIFNYPGALRHCLEVVRPGGHFITVTPANAWMGHGFYQFSPELFFRVFNEQNGFRLRKIVLFDFLKSDAPFFEVLDPAVTGLRTRLFSSRPMQLAVLAQRTAELPVLVHPPQQSDYVASWERHRERNADPNATPLS